MATARTKAVKGRTGYIKNIETKSGIGEKRISNMVKAFKNRERRAVYWGKKLNYEGENIDVTIQKLSQKQYLTPQLYIDFAKVKTVKDYNKVMKLLSQDKTPTFKMARTYKMRDWLETAIERTINIEDDPALFKRIGEMSDIEIAEFAFNYSNLIATVFEYYKGNLPTESEREETWNSIRRALGLAPLSQEDMMQGMVI